MVPVFFKVLVIVLAASKSILFPPRIGGKFFCTLPTCRKYEHTYTLYPKDPDILQD